MLSPLASLGVATLCFYIPSTLGCIFLCDRQRKSPLPLAWFLLVLVCLIRIAGAVLSLLVPSNNVGIDAAAFALLSAGGLPLILVMILVMSIVKRTECPDDSASHYAILILRLLFITTLALTIAGVRMHAQLDSPTVVRIGQKLAEAGSIASIVPLILCFGGKVYVWAQYRALLSSSSKKILIGNMLVAPLLLLRLVYFCLAMFTVGSEDTRWNPLTGSIAALVCMAMIPEFVALLVYAWVGLTIDVSKDCCGPSAHCHTADRSSKAGDEEHSV